MVSNGKLRYHRKSGRKQGNASGRQKVSLCVCVCVGRGGGVYVCECVCVCMHLLRHSTMERIVNSAFIHSFIAMVMIHHLHN